jgi:hypothetical protein
MKVLSKILFFLIGLSSFYVNAQTGKPFVYRNIINEPDGIWSATVMSNGKFAYAQAEDDFFSIHVIDTGGNELLSRRFGNNVSMCKLIYYKGHIYGITNNTIDADSNQRKFNLILFKLDTCLNMVAAKQVYYKTPLNEYMYIQTNYWNNSGINNKEEFFFSLSNVIKPKGWCAASNTLVVFDTLLNLQFSPYYPALETVQTSSYNGMYQMSGFYEQLNTDSSLYLMKPFYSELNLETKECNMWVIEQNSEAVFGYLSGILDPDNHKMYAALIGYSGRGYSHGVVDYSNLDAAKYTIMCDTSMWAGCEKIVYNWGKKNQITMIELSDFKNATDQYAYTTVRTFNKELAETGSKKIHGWGNLKNGLDDTFTMLTLGTTVLTNNKLFVFGFLRDEMFTSRSFYYVLDSNLNFATKTIDPDKYHCSKNRVLPTLVIVPKDTFLLTNEMFEPAKVIVHNIKIKQLDLIAGLPFSKRLVINKSKHMLIKYLPDNQIECEIKGPNALLQYVLYDVSAKKILDGKAFDNKIVISPNKLIPGVYTISITKNHEIFTEKIIVQ